MKWPNHGGNPELMRQLLHIKPDTQILDFSANINPLGPPLWLKEAINSALDQIQFYPNPDYTSAVAAIANRLKVQQESILLTNGGAEAIYLVAKLMEGKKVLIVHPTFSEYEQACLIHHAQVEHLFLDQGHNWQFPVQQVLQKIKSVSAVFICRPNNPTGTMVEPSMMKVLVEEGHKNQTKLIVDEAFIDFLAEDESLSQWVTHYPNLFILRSMTKIYTIPGLRLGYILAQPEEINKLKGFQIPWSVNTLAASLIPLLIEDVDFLEQTRSWLRTELEHMQKMLIELDFYLTPSLVNFYLLRDQINPEQTANLFSYLLENGILARHTHNFRGLEGKYVRLALRSAAENQQLLDILRKWREKPC